jgi:ABC-2 type transport system permease protein
MNFSLGFHCACPDLFFFQDKIIIFQSVQVIFGQTLSIMMGMIMALMGGCWYPLELFPTVVQNIVKILPTTWAMQGLLTLVLRGGGLIDILPAAGVLLGFAAIFFSIGVMRFRYE